VAKLFYDQDADLGVLKGKKIAIIGYGIQGRPHSLCLRDSGVEVIAADLEGSKGWENAITDKMPITSAAEAAKQGQVIALLTPDDVQARVYESAIAPQLKTGKALVFAHGFNIHYHQIVPPTDVDVFMVAPKGPGSLVRQLFEQGKGVPALLAVYQDASGQAKQLGLAYAKGLGCTRAGLLETTFKEETETDLFGEQAVLCGGCSALIMAGFEVLLEAGYQPESAYLEVLHELKLIVDMIQEDGISGMRKRVSDTAEYGDMTRGPRVVTEETKEAMREILDEIQSGEFAREWILENQAKRPVFKALEKAGLEHPIEQVGRDLRAMMPWLKK